MSEQDIEAKIRSKNFSAPRLTPEEISSKIIGVSYTTLPSGKTMICELTLMNGYTVRGEASTVSKANFDDEIGREISFEKARDKIWQLEGYLLQEYLFRQ